MDADREKAGSGGIGSRRGSVSLELIGSLPIILLAVLALNLGAYLLLHAFRRRSG